MVHYQAARLFVGILLFSVSSAVRAEDSDAPHRAESADIATADPPRDTFIILPLHVHVMRCQTETDLDCKLTDDDLRRVLGKINGVWHRAGIHWRLASLAHEDAANVEAFAELKAKASAHQLPVPLEAFAGIAPAAGQKPAGLHVYYIHAFAVNGVYLGGRTCFVKETAALRPVEGGIDEPLPRVTSHELGHALGLPHRQDTFNLMASGTTGTLFSVDEVQTARAGAKKIDGAMTVNECEAAIADNQTAINDPQGYKSMKDALDALPSKQDSASTRTP